MAKKHVELEGESHLVTTIRESATSIWLAGLGAFSKAQEEGGKLFEALVKEGEAVQNRASKAAQEAMSDVRSTATGTLDKLEHVFAAGVAGALHSLNVATKHDIDNLTKRVAELSKATDKLSNRMEGTKAKFRAHKPEAVATKRTAAKMHSRTHS